MLAKAALTGLNLCMMLPVVVLMNLAALVDQHGPRGGWHRLLVADMAQLSARLMVMRLAAQSTDVNVLKIVEDHPCLLLQETFALDSQASLPS